MTQENAQESSGKYFTIKWCGAAHSLTDTSFPFVNSQEELDNDDHSCGNCDNGVPYRTMMSDVDINEVGCLCGYRSYSCTDVYTDRVWTTENTVRLFCIDRNGNPQMHVFKATEDAPPLRQQVNEFCRSARRELTVMMPMDPLPGVSPELIKQARFMAKNAYMVYDGEFYMAHHYEALYTCM